MMSEQEAVLVAVHLTVKTGGFDAWCLHRGYERPKVVDLAKRLAVSPLGLDVERLEREIRAVAVEEERLIGMYVRERLREFFGAETRAEIVQYVEELVT